jgi:hypothetical protein
MAPQDPKPSRHRQADLPESLHAQIEGFRQQLWRVKVAEAILAGFFGLLFSFILVFGLDRVWATPGIVRLAILISGTSLFAFFAPYWIHRWVFGHRREDQLARLIAQRFPKLGDRLLGVVELQDQREDDQSLSPELRLAAMRRVATEAKGRDFEKALPASRHRSWSLAVLATFALAASALVFLPKAGMNSLKRWLMPLSDTPRYTFTSLGELPEELIVPLGEEFQLTVALRKESESKPSQGTARLGAQDAVTASLAQGHYQFKLPGQQEKGLLALSIGDARQKIMIIPVSPPSLDSPVARIQYPDYIGQKPKTIDLRAGVLPVLAGSKVALGAQTSRELAQASMTLTPLPVVEGLDGETEELPATVSEQSYQMRVTPKEIWSPMISLPNTPSALRIRWSDTLGLADDGGFQLRVEPVQDQAPAPYIQGTERQRIMLEEEVAEFQVTSEDDYGIRQIGLEWRGEFTKPTDDTPANGELTLATGEPTMRRLSNEVVFSPSTLGITPQKLTVRAYAEDYFPGRGRVYSEPITLFILTRDEHATMLKNRFDRIIGELEDVARREQNNFDENQRLERADSEELQSEESRERLEQQKDNEDENTERMEDLAERMEELFKDSVRNGEIDKDIMKNMSEALRNMQELGKEDMPEVAKELSESQDERSTSEQAKKDLQEAIEKQKEVLEKMQKTIEQANKANRNFEASTFINRLKRAASEESGIGSKLVSLIDSLVGLSIEQVDPADQRVVGELATQQKQTASDVRWIQEDLGHFYARTQKEIHKDLLLEMQTSRIDTGLDDNRERIAINQTYRAIVASNDWAAKLLAWAKKLEGDQEDGGGGGGEGGDSPPSLDDEDFEFMLKVMRMIQEEQDIRYRTRALEQLRRALGFEAEGYSLPLEPELN